VSCSSAAGDNRNKTVANGRAIIGNNIGEWAIIGKKN
jgi:hypothetical protein